MINTTAVRQNLRTNPARLSTVIPALTAARRFAWRRFFA